MPIAARQAISCTSLLSLALPAALFASLAQANIPEDSVTSLEERIAPASRVVRQSVRPAANDSREGSLHLQARPDAGQKNTEQASATTAESDPAVIEDHTEQPAAVGYPNTASEPSSRPAFSSPQANKLSPARLLRPTPGEAGPGAAHDDSRAVSNLSPIIDLAEPPTGWRQARYDFKALGVPSLRYTHHGIPRARTAVTDVAGEWRRERNVELKYVALSDLVWPASSRLQAGLAS
nr:hypothetical protein [uncultured Pseudomonas sp.]